MFDYRHGEAIGLVRAQHGKHTNAGLVIMDTPPAGYSGGSGYVRTMVRDVDGKAQIVLYDAKAKPRLRFTVPKSGHPAIEFLDASGKVTARFPRTMVPQGVRWNNCP
jgi:hypothetical protein